MIMMVQTGRELVYTVIVFWLLMQERVNASGIFKQFIMICGTMILLLLLN